MIAIVGAGITGLALAHELDRRGVEFIVLEASGRAGGVIRSAEVDGRILDWGPQRLRLTRHVTKLIRETGLTEQVIRAPRGLDLFVYRNGRLRTVPFSAGAFLTSDIVSLPGRLRILLEPFTAEARPDERVSHYFTRKVGREIYEALIAPLYGGLYGSDPADMEVGLSLIHVLHEFGVRRSLLLPLLFRNGGRVQPPPAATLQTGMQALPDAMARSLGDRLRLHCPVRALHTAGSGWKIETDHGPVDARAIVLTCPAHTAALLLNQCAPAAASAVAALRYNPLAVVHLDAETDLRGLGFQVAFTEPGLALRGVTWNHSLFGRRGLHTAYLGGSRHPDVVDLPDDELADLARREFHHCTGFDAAPLAVARERMPAWDVSWRATRDLTLPPGLHFAANWWSRPGIPGRLAEAERLARKLATDVATQAHVRA